MTLARAAATAHAVLVLVVVVAPAVVVREAGHRAGGDTGSGDLLLAGTVVGTAAAVLAWRRLTAPGGPPLTDRWIAALAGLGVLAPAATAVPAVVLHWLTGVPGGADLVPLLWGGSLAVAVAAADVVQRRLPRWLSSTASAARTR